MRGRINLFEAAIASSVYAWKFGYETKIESLMFFQQGHAKNIVLIEKKQKNVQEESDRECRVGVDEDS